MGLSWITIEPFYTVCCSEKALRTIFRIPRISRYCPGHTKQVFITNSILTVHNLYFSSVLHAIFLSLFSNTPKPIADQIKLHLSTRTDHYFLLPLLKYTNHQKNLPFIGFKIWNSFLNVCSVTGLLDKSMLIYWKFSKFKKCTKTFFLQGQKFFDINHWDPANHNIFHLETKVITGTLNWGSTD